MRHQFTRRKEKTGKAKKADRREGVSYSYKYLTPNGLSDWFPTDLEAEDEGRRCFRG